MPGVIADYGLHTLALSQISLSSTRRKLFHFTHVGQEPSGIAVAQEVCYADGLRIWHRLC